MFEEEKPFLQQLPPTRFEYYRIGERTVHFDGYIEVDGAYYHAPPQRAGTRVTAHIGRLWIRIIDPKTQELIREHAVTGKGQRRTVDAYLPKQTPVKVEELAARVAGPGCKAFAERLVEDRGASALRALYGMLDLLRRYEAAAVDQAEPYQTVTEVLQRFHGTVTSLAASSDHTIFEAMSDRLVEFPNGAGPADTIPTPHGVDLVAVGAQGELIFTNGFREHPSVLYVLPRPYDGIPKPETVLDSQPQSL